jgi:hypothetical protein
VSLIPATAPDFFLEDTPTAVLVRQVLGAIAQFEKASLVAFAAATSSGDRSAYDFRPPHLMPCAILRSRAALSLALQAERPRLSLRKIADRLAEQGYTLKGRPYAAMSVSGMLRG